MIFYDQISMNFNHCYYSIMILSSLSIICEVVGLISIFTLQELSGIILILIGLILSTITFGMYGYYELLMNRQSF